MQLRMHHKNNNDKKRQITKKDIELQNTQADQGHYHSFPHKVQDFVVTILNLLHLGSYGVQYNSIDLHETNPSKKKIRCELSHLLEIGTMYYYKVYQYKLCQRNDLNIIKHVGSHSQQSFTTKNQSSQISEKLGTQNGKKIHIPIVIGSCPIYPL